MTNSNEENENDKQTTDSEIITWGDLKRLEKSAEAGDLEAQNRLVEMEGLKNYDEYKGLKRQVIIDVQTSIDPKINSIFSPLVHEDTRKAMESMASMVLDTSELKSAIDGIAETFASSDAIRHLLEDAKRPWMQELTTTLTDNERFLHVSDRVSDSFLVNYYPRAQERLIDQIAENNRLLAERNQLDQEKLNRERQGPEVRLLTTEPDITSPKWKQIVPNKGDDWQIIELWEMNHTNSEIGERLHKAPRTVTNRISALRLRFPTAGILTDKERRKLLQKL